jgi:triphosphoribosyl-dephospho-CoA synthase
MNPKLHDIANKAVKALLYEVSATPKPGLVDRENNGAHKDMNFLSFVDSSLVLYKTFYECAESGEVWQGSDGRKLLAEIRPIGIKGEDAMYNVTGGVNTHKGAVFSLGIICAAAGHLSKNIEAPMTIEKLLIFIKEMARGLSSELEVAMSKEELTAGERLFKNHGVLGIRGEVEGGFPSVINHGLPELRRMVDEGSLDLNAMMVQLLLVLLTQVNDSNVLARAGLEGLDYVRAHTKKVLELGGMYTTSGIEALRKMDLELTTANISPGGTADLVAVTLMFYLLENPRGLLNRIHKARGDGHAHSN